MVSRDRNGRRFFGVDPLFGTIRERTETFKVILLIPGVERLVRCTLFCFWKRMNEAGRF